MKMKKSIICAILFLIGFSVFSQELEYIPVVGTPGLENLVVEKITPSTEAYEAGVPEGSITYRVFVDMEEEYILLGYTGNDAEELPFEVSSTEPFYNVFEMGVGGISGKNQNSYMWPAFPHLMHDSYGADGRIGSDKVGIPFSLDTDGTVDGITALTEDCTPVSDLGLYESHPIFEDNTTTSMSNLNGGMFIFRAQGPTSDNMVLVMQLTTAGELSFSGTITVTDINSNMQKANHIGYNLASNDATLSDLRVDDVTIADFAPDIFAYTIELSSGSDVPLVTATTNDINANAVITPAVELPGTTLVVVTAADGTELTYSVNFTLPSYPLVGAPTPPQDAANVISVFSDAYNNIANTDFDPWWDQTTEATIDMIAEGDYLLTYANFNYQGIQIGSPIDASSMDTLHIDMWTADATTVDVYCISTGPVETSYYLTITEKEWVSYDIPLSVFSGIVDMTDIIQFKFAGGDGAQTIYLDNIYFYKEAPVAGSDASLKDIKVAGTSIVGFSPTTYNYTVEVPFGTVIPPTVTVTTNDENATADVTQATDITEKAQIVVTAQNETDISTYTVGFSIAPEFTVPQETAPIPTQDPADVISIFSDAYTDLPGTDFDPWWNQKTNTTLEKDLYTEGDSLLKYEGFNYQGTTFGSTIDVTGMNVLHIDLWTANASSVNVFCISSGPVETAFALPITIGEWVSYDIPLTAFSEIVDMADLIQFKFDDAGAEDSPTIYIDNLYFYKGAEKNNDASLSDISVDGVSLSDFDATNLTYNVFLDYGTTTVPTVIATSNDPNASVAVTDAISLPGTTEIEVTAEDGYTKTTYSIDFSFASSSISAKDKKNILIYSNNDILHVDCYEELISGRIEVYDITGNLVISSPISSLNEHIKINSKGVLVVRVANSSNNIVLIQKLVIQ